MNLNFDDLESEAAFNEALESNPGVRSWLINRLLSYSSKTSVFFLYISIDNFTKSKKPSFDWSIWSCKPEDSKKPFSDGFQVNGINGGLIYREFSDSYTSHT